MASDAQSESVNPKENPLEEALKPDKAIRNEKGQYAPGSVGNPNGRPKSRIITNMLRKKFEENPELLEAIVDTAIARATVGEEGFFKEIRNMIEGKPPDVVITEDEDGKPQPLKVIQVVFSNDGST